MKICPFLYNCILLAYAVFYCDTVSAQQLDYKVYSAVINFEYGSQKANLYIVDKLRIDNELGTDLRQYKPSCTFANKKLFSSEWKAFIKSINTSQAIPKRLYNTFFIKNKATLIPPEYAYEETWTNKLKQSKNTPQRTLILAFSPVYFLSNQQKALCTVSLINPGHGESVDLYLLEKLSNEWKIVCKSNLKLIAY